MRNKVLEPYSPILTTDKRYILIGGGRAGGRSYFASQYAMSSLISKPYFRCAIMRYVLGDVRNSIFQEIADRLEENELTGGKSTIDVKEHTLTINLNKNTINGIGFRKSSSDQKAKLKSLAGYTDVIIEEAEEVSEEDFLQLDDSLRTIKADIKIFLLFNFPPKEHWIIKRWFNLLDIGIDGFYKAELKDSEKDSTLFVYSNYQDNLHNLNQTTLDNFDKYKRVNPDHYYNMIMGYVPSGARGRIFKDWQPITSKEFDELDYTSFYSCDYGFTNDPCAVCEIKMHNDNIYVKELIYETGLINKRLSERMEQVGIPKYSELFADGAEPKSTAELQTYGWNAINTTKGKGSRKAGVDLLLGKNVYYTEDSVNLIKEMQGYCWALDRNKNPTNEPQDGDDHILDSLRSGVFSKLKQPFVGVA